MCIIPITYPCCTDGVLKDRDLSLIPLSVMHFLTNCSNENTKLSFPRVSTQVQGLDPNPSGILWPMPKVSRKVCLCLS